MQPGFAAGQAHAQAVGPLPRALRLAGSNLALGRRCRGWRRGGSTPAHATTAALPDVATALGRRASPAGIKDDATQIIGNTPLVSPATGPPAALPGPGLRWTQRRRSLFPALPLVAA